MSSTSTAERWHFPYAGPSPWQLTRTQWARFIAAALLIHVLGVGAAYLSGTFQPPSRDHLPAMQQILNQGYISRSAVPPGLAYYMAFKTVISQALGVPYWTAKLWMDVIPVVLTGALTLQLALLLTRNQTYARIAAFGQLLAPIYLLGVGIEEAAIVFIPFFLAGLALFVRTMQGASSRRGVAMIGTGFLLGCATLVRGNSQFIIGAFAAFAFWLAPGQSLAARARHAAGLTTWFAVGHLIATLPWMWLQYRLGREGFTTVPIVYEIYYDGFVRHRGNAVAEWVRNNYRVPERSLAGVIQFNWNWLRRDPLALLSIYAVKIPRAWYMSDSGRWDIITLVLHAPYWVTCVWGTWCWHKRAPRDPALIFAWCVIVYMWAVSAVMAGIARYSAPLYGLISLLAAPALLVMHLGWQRRHPLQYHAARPNPQL